MCEHERLILPSDTPPHCKTERLTATLRDDVESVMQLFPDAKTRVFDVPVSIRRVLYDARNRRCDDVDPEGDAWETAQQVAKRHGEYSQGSFLALWIRIHLHPYATHRLDTRQIAWAVQEVDKRLWKSRLQDGEPVGHLCARYVLRIFFGFTFNYFWLLFPTL